MTHGRHLVFGVVCAFLTAGVGFAEPAPLDSSLPGWSRLEFRAKKMTFSMRVDIHFDVVAAAKAGPDLETDGEHTFLEPEGERVVGVTMVSRGLGRPVDSVLWVREADATALVRRQTESGKRKRYRVYRFAEDGVWQLRKVPGPGEEDLPGEQWSQSSDAFIEIGGFQESDLGVTEPLALFFIAAGGVLEKPGDEIVFPVYASGEVLSVRATAVEMDSLKVDYVQRGKGGESRQRGSKDLLKVRIDAAPGGSSADEGDFVFMGLKGDVRLWIDPESRAIVQVAGKVPVAGGVRVRLQSLTLTP
jgi:hypothetical protein